METFENVNYSSASRGLCSGPCRIEGPIETVTGLESAERYTCDVVAWIHFRSGMSL